MWKWRKKIGISLAVSGLALLLAATFFSCEQSSPMAVEEPVTNVLAKDSGAESADQTSSGRTFDPISDITVSRDVTPEMAGSS